MDNFTLTCTHRLAGLLVRQAGLTVKYVGLVVLLSVWSELKAQPYFEGTLLYKHSIETMSLSKDSLENALPKGSIYLYKNEFYKGYVFAKDTVVYIYHGGLAVCMVKSSADPTVFFADYNKKIYAPKKVVVDEGQYNINGYPCIRVTSTFKDYSVQAYYHTTVRHHPEVFVRHKAYGYARIMHAAKGGIFVKSIISYKDYVMTIELVNIDQRAIPDSEFGAVLFHDYIRK